MMKKVYVKDQREKKHHGLELIKQGKGSVTYQQMQEKTDNIEYSPEALRQLSSIRLLNALLGRSDFDPTQDLLYDCMTKECGEGSSLCVTGVVMRPALNLFSNMTGKDLQNGTPGMPALTLDELPLLDGELTDQLAGLTEIKIREALGEYLDDKTITGMLDRLAYIRELVKQIREEDKNLPDSERRIYYENDYSDRGRLKALEKRMSEDKRVIYPSLTGRVVKVDGAGHETDKNQDGMDMEPLYHKFYRTCKNRLRRAGSVKEKVRNLIEMQRLMKKGSDVWNDEKDGKDLKKRHTAESAMKRAFYEVMDADLLHGLFAENAKLQKDIAAKYRMMREKNENRNRRNEEVNLLFISQNKELYSELMVFENACGQFLENSDANIGVEETGGDNITSLAWGIKQEEFGKENVSEEEKTVITGLKSVFLHTGEGGLQDQRKLANLKNDLDGYDTEKSRAYMRSVFGEKFIGKFELSAGEEERYREEDASAVQNAIAKSLAKEMEIRSSSDYKKKLDVSYMLEQNPYIGAEKEKDDEKINRRTIDRYAAANRMRESIDKIVDSKIECRNKISINIKKKMDFRTVEMLSDFVPFLVSTKDADPKKLEKLMTLYGDGEVFKRDEQARKKKEEEDEKKARAEGKMIPKKSGEEIARRKKEHDKKTGETTFAAMDILTEQIMLMDEYDLDISCDKAIVKNAAKLEATARAVKAYKNLLAKNPDYLEKLHLEKVDSLVLYKNKADYDDHKNDSCGEILLQKLDRLSAVCEFYRIRRLVIEDSYYINSADKELSMEEQKGDKVHMKRLKGFLRASYHAAENIRRVFGGETPGKHPAVVDDDEQVLVQKERRPLTWKNDRERKALIEKHLSDEKEHERLLSNLESQRYFLASKSQDETFSLTKVKKDADPDVALFSDDNSFSIKMASEKGHIGLAKKIKEMKKEKRGDQWGKNSFIGGKNESLKDLSISDDWDRMEYAFSTVLNYRRTDSEMLEMMDLLTSQAKDIDKMKKDSELMAYYESAYSEMALRLMFSIYATMKRLYDTSGEKLLVMHPADIVTQMTSDMKLEIMVANIITNVIYKSNNQRVKSILVNSNADGHYNMTFEDMLFYNNNFGNVLTKINDAMGNIYEFAKVGNSVNEG
ncbi:MAG: hypothetical protein K6C41_09520, partial [Lachnospiraceae bacterium]|nr:hypothetical protein [Lachnospiraceae bacterium]